MAEKPRFEEIGELGAKYRQAFIEGMARAYGGRPQTAQNITPEREIDLYLQPTSPAAREAIRMGGTLDDAVAANRLYANHMRQQAQQIRLQMQGAPKEEIAKAVQQAGFSDDQIAQTCRRHAYELGKQYSQDDPEKEVAWHEKMLAKIAARRSPAAPTYTTLPTGQEGAE